MQYTLKSLNTSGTKLGSREPGHVFMSNVYYNPFFRKSTIKYTLPEDTWVKIKIFDKFGREVTLLVNEFRNSGAHEIEFDAKSFAEGIFFYTIQAGEFKQTRRLLLVC